MEFTDEQKLIVTLLTDIHKSLKIKDSVDPEFVQEAVTSDRGWALHWKYPGIFQGHQDLPQEVTFVTEVLELWQRLETSYGELSANEKGQLADQAKPFGSNVKFPGFDGNGNRDGDAFGIAQLLVHKMGLWTTFHDHDLNSHSSMSEVYGRMLEAETKLNKPPADYLLSADDMVLILNAMRYPGDD